MVVLVVFFFFFKQKTAYEMRISDWSSDVCSSDLLGGGCDRARGRCRARLAAWPVHAHPCRSRDARAQPAGVAGGDAVPRRADRGEDGRADGGRGGPRSEEHTSELQSLMRISYAVFCLKKKKDTKQYSKRPNYHTQHATHH